MEEGSFDKKTLKELRRAAVRAIRKVMASADSEPSAIILVRSGAEGKATSEYVQQEISAWLFRRGKQDDSSAD